MTDGAASGGSPDLCRPFLDVLPITGASVTMISANGAQSTLSSSDAIAGRIDELQFELGEGPLALAVSSGELVTIPDAGAAQNDWPMFGAALASLPIGAVFSVPMKMGAATVGVVTLYRDRPGVLLPDEQASALAIASAIAGAAVQRAMASATDDAPPETSDMPALRREVHQATGMILVQLDTTATVAYSRLQAYAFANGRTVQSVAHDVVMRKLVLDDEAP